MKMQLGEEKWKKWLLDIEAAEQTGRKFVSSNPISYFKSRMGRPLTGHIIEKLNIPLLAINGSEDPFTPPHVFKEIHEALQRKNSDLHRTVVIDKVGHGLMSANEIWSTSRVSKEINSFLDQII